jgi:hypothetical protein
MSTTLSSPARSVRTGASTSAALDARVGEIFRQHQVIGLATYGEQYNAMHVNQTFTGIALDAPR